MARVALLGAERAPLLARWFYEGGNPGPIVAALATVPELLEATLPFVGAALGPSAIDARTKELAILRTSALLDCRYCIESRSLAALDVGITTDEVRSIRVVPPAPPGELSSPREVALLAWVDEVAGGRGAVPEAVADELARHLRDFEIVELTVTVGATMFLNRFCTSLQLESSPETLARLAEAGLA